MNNPIVIEANYDFEITRKTNNFKQTPIIINSYNRLSCLKSMIESLEENGYKNIYIIDNHSSYAPLLKFYREKNLRVFYLKKNIGSLAIWKSNIYNLFCTDYYVYSDPDIIPDPSCPDDFLNQFYLNLEKHPDLQKVGFGLRIDDLPDYYHLKYKVVTHESKFWNNRLSHQLFKAPIDTTFALYRPFVQGDDRLEAGRMDFPYVAKHYPWYLDYTNLPEDEKYYLKTIETSTHWANNIDNYSGLQKYYQLIKQDKLVLLWKIRGCLGSILRIIGLKKK